MNWLPSAVHASSTIESGAPWIDCLELFMHPPPSNLIWSPMNWLPSAVYASSTIESGAPRIDCLALFVHPPPSNLIQSPMNWLLFMHPSPSNLIRSPMNWLSFMHPPPSNLIWSPMNWLPSAVHASSTIWVWSSTNWLPSAVRAFSIIESGVPWIDCLALFMGPPLSSTEPPIRGKYSFCYFPNRFLHQKCVYMYIIFFFVFVLCCAEKKEGETRVNYFKSFWLELLWLR